MQSLPLCCSSHVGRGAKQAVPKFSFAAVLALTHCTLQRVWTKLYRGHTPGQSSHYLAGNTTEKQSKAAAGQVGTPHHSGVRKMCKQVVITTTPTLLEPFL